MIPFYVGVIALLGVGVYLSLLEFIEKVHSGRSGKQAKKKGAIFVFLFIFSAIFLILLICA